MTEQNKKPQCYKCEENFNLDKCCECDYCPDCTRNIMDSIIKAMKQEVNDMYKKIEI